MKRACQEQQLYCELKLSEAHCLYLGQVSTPYQHHTFPKIVLNRSKIKISIFFNSQRFSLCIHTMIVVVTLPGEVDPEVSNSSPSSSPSPCSPPPLGMKSDAKLSSSLAAKWRQQQNGSTKQNKKIIIMAAALTVDTLIWLPWGPVRASWLEGRPHFRGGFVQQGTAEAVQGSV